MLLKEIDSYLNLENWKVKENANMAFSLQGLNNYISSEATKKYWLEKIYTPDIKEAHESGDIHVHDLNLLSAYCVGWDLADILTQGITGVEGKVESSPAKHFRTALGHIYNFFYTLQGEASGAQALSSVDTLLAPFIAYDKLSYEDVKQAVQEWVFNLNVPTRVGFQTPFTNITLDFNVPAKMRDEPVIIGGERMDRTYGEFQEEMDLFNRAFLEVMAAGDAKGRVFTFPIPTYNIDKDFDYDDERLNPLWEVTAKYGVPYFANFVNSDLSPDDARSMCCRLRLDTRELRHKGGGLFGANPLTGSIGVVTINLPRIGHLADDKESFLSILDERLDIAAKSLDVKRKVVEEYTENNLYPYTKHYLQAVKQRTGRYWSNHFATIGIIGLEEAMVNLLGDGMSDSEGARDFGLGVMDHIKDRLLEFQDKYDCNFNLEATPAEGTSHRLTQLDKKAYPDMKAFKNDSLVIYSNSSQPPVNTYSDPFELLEQQNEFQTKYTGGTVIHFFLGEQVKDPALVKKFVKTVCSKYNIPYFTVTPTFSVCKEHGYIVGEVHKCPTCGEPTEVYSRIVGYLRPVKQWNKSKGEEFKVRGLYDSGI